MASIVETYNTSTIYNNVSWFRPKLNTRISYHINSIPTSCNCLTLQMNKCTSRVVYACYSSNVAKTDNRVIYACGTHLKRVTTDEFCVIYKRYPKKRNYSYVDFVLIQQVHSPDTYMEYCTTFRNAYLKILNDMRQFLDARDFRAMQVGDQDGSYPIEMARLKRIIEMNKSTIGYNLYNSYFHNYQEIKKLHTSYITTLDKYKQLHDSMNDFLEIKFFNENNVLSLKFNKREICSICFDEVTADNGGQLKECNHTFHNSCLMKWLTFQSNDNSSCPCCRKPLCNLLLYKL